MLTYLCMYTRVLPLSLRDFLPTGSRAGPPALATTALDVRRTLCPQPVLKGASVSYWGPHLNHSGLHQEGPDQRQLTQLEKQSKSSFYQTP